MVIQNGTVSSLGVRDFIKDYIEDMTSAVPVLMTPTQEVMDGMVMGCILSVGSALIISTNLLVAIALVLLIQKKGSQSWCFVLNLAIADILVGLAITGIATDALKGRVSSMHKEVCLLRMAFVTVPSAASILTMFFISLDRYMAIKLPLRYSQLMGKKMITGTVVSLWVLSTAVGFMPNMVEEMQHSRNESICTFFSVIEPQSIIVVFCVAFFPVLLVFIYFYLDILKIACSHQRRIRRAMQAGSRCLLPNRYLGHVKALKTVAVLVGCFTLCWCPFFIVSVVQVLCPPCKLYGFLENHLWLLGLSNSLINPLVYAFWQREVRQQLCDMFACIKASQCCVKVSYETEGCPIDNMMVTQTRHTLDQTLPCQIIFREPTTVPFSA